MNNLDFESWLSIIVSFGYIFYAAASFETDPKKKFYNRLLSNQTFAMHFILSAFVCYYGYYRSVNGHYQEIFYVAPFLFLIFLRFFNWLTKYSTDRNILIASKWDYKPDEYKWYIDGLFTIFIIALPIIISGLAMNKIRFGEFFR